MPQIRRIVGHSLGGAVALELQKRNPNLQTVTYGAPVTSISGGERYRELLDPVSIFDRGANMTLPSGINPHSYNALGARYHEFSNGTSMNGYTAPDGTNVLYR
jgi:pimeloyl-ACP methyl ester carboxylesterase